MTVIRPNLPPVPGSVPQSDHARLEAKRALFAEAFGKATGASQPAASTAAQAAAPAAPTAQARSAETPQKVLRPGSLLDIRV